MASLHIEVIRDLETINEAIDELVKEKKVSIISAKVYKAKAKGMQAGLYNLVKSKLKQWIKEETKHKLIAEDSGDLKYIRAEYNKFNNFLLSSDKELKDQDEFKRATSDRSISRILGGIRRKLGQVKQTSIEQALGGRTILSFFNSMGLVVLYKLKE